MTALHDAWTAHLETVRWFGGKGSGARVVHLEPLAWWTPPDADPAVRSEIATLEDPRGRTEHYQFLVAHHGGAAPDGATVLGADPDTGAAITDATTDLVALAAFVAATAPDFAGVPVGVWAGEQSNTTLTLGDTDLYKLFRKVEPGPNLDTEVLVALSGGAVPEVRHRLVGDWPAGTLTDLGNICERIAGATDGWVLATRACADERDFADEAHALGVALRAVHDQLRDAFGEQTASGDVLAGVMGERLDAALDAAPQLAEHADALRARFDALRGSELRTQRVHGDFHLGQTLASPAGWTIIDFEGEPAKTAAERRAFDSVWRDVAGMTRSFDYARSAHADPSGPGATRWADRAREGFLQGYCEGTTQAAVLTAYETDKAVYEVLYELRNRPDWVDIPLRAVSDTGSGHHPATHHPSMTDHRNTEHSNTEQSKER
ncbi:phosphotransferase [Propioniciclava soli]|uniref:Maltokinase n=1 Tax=Propioniciclava soli TaxID=2775081 RepID=A0ABZ3C2X9_9ACTN